MHSLLAATQPWGSPAWASQIKPPSNPTTPQMHVPLLPPSAVLHKSRQCCFPCSPRHAVTEHRQTDRQTATS